MEKITGIQIYDDFVSQRYLQYLQNTLIDSSTFNYSINLSTHDFNKKKEQLYTDLWDFQAVNPLIRTPYYIKEESQILTPFIAVMPYVWRAKINVNFVTERESKPLGIHTDLPELDGKHEYYSAIFYLNGTDGCTDIKDPNTEEFQKVEGKENRLVVFPGYYEHTGYTPTNAKLRYVFNFVFFGSFFPHDIRKAEMLLDT